MNVDKELERIRFFTRTMVVLWIINLICSCIISLKYLIGVATGTIMAYLLFWYGTRERPKISPFFKILFKGREHDKNNKNNKSKKNNKNR